MYKYANDTLSSSTEDPESCLLLRKQDAEASSTRRHKSLIAKKNREITRKGWCRAWRFMR